MLLERELVAFRREDGGITVLGNRCPHRFVELHLGKLIGDELQCPYHGLRFDGDGRCTLNPHGDGKLPPGTAVGSYASCERHGVVWVWMGDPAQADPDVIPDFSAFEEQEGVAIVRGRSVIDADYRLVTDNLLDLTHTEFLHPHFRAGGSSNRTSYEVRAQGDTVHAIYVGRGEPVAGMVGELWKSGGGSEQDEINLHRDIAWHPASNLHLDLWFGRTDEGREKGVYSSSVHLLAPTARNRTQYHWLLARNVRLDDPDFDKIMHEGTRMAFEDQDGMAIRSQQSFVGDTDLLQLKPALLATDRAAILARRKLKSLIQAAEPRERRSAAKVPA